MGLEEFLALVRSRRSVRHFRPDALPAGALDALLEAARWAPSGYNLQPTHWIVVERRELREALVSACMGQKQVAEAPVVVVFAGDVKVAEHNFARVLAQERAEGCINESYEQALRKFVGLAFSGAPLGLGRLGKWLAAPVMRWFAPVPAIPVVEMKAWLSKQMALGAMNFLLAAKAAGLATVPMEGFDEARVSKVLRLPRHMVPLLVVPVGYGMDEGTLKKSRLPRESAIHRDGW